MSYDLVTTLFPFRTLQQQNLEKKTLGEGDHHEETF